MKFAIKQLEDRIAPLRFSFPSQQAIVVGGGRGSKAGGGLVLTSQGGGFQQAIVAGGGRGSKTGGGLFLTSQGGGFQQAFVAGGGKAGPSLILSHQGNGFGFGGFTQQAIFVGGGHGSKAGPGLFMAWQ